MAVDLNFAVWWRMEPSSFLFRRLCLVDVLVDARGDYSRSAVLTATKLLGFLCFLCFCFGLILWVGFCFEVHILVVCFICIEPLFSVVYYVLCW